MPHFETSIPFLQPIDYKTLSWRYRSVPQRYAARGMKDREVILMSGKGLGGTSLLESGIYLPENPEDFARWERQYKLTDWTKERTAPFFFSVTSDDEPGAPLPPPPTPIESGDFWLWTKVE